VPGRQPPVPAGRPSHRRTGRGAGPAAVPLPGGTPADAWTGSLLPGDLAAPNAAGPGSPEARHAAAFGVEQPVLPTTGGSGLRLRRPEGRDIDGIVTACRDPLVARWTSVPQPYERPYAEDFVHRHTPELWTQGIGAVYAMVEPSDTWVGGIDLNITPGDALVGEIGFLVSPRARGRGYATAAMEAITDWGLTTLGLARVEWRAYSDDGGNLASRRVAEKAGFVLEGLSRGGVVQRGQRRDCWVAARLPGDPGIRP
jgi:RimJ/RimL family protein N-acetyltransferase